MFREILIDFRKGVIQSLRIDLFAKCIWKNPKLLRLFLKILKYNFIFHVLPILLVYFLSYISDFDTSGALNYINAPINTISSFFHLLHYMDLVCNINKDNILVISKKDGSKPVFAPSISITMSIFYIAIRICISFINFVLHDNLKLFSFIITFGILNIYHAFYCFNNLWQQQQIEINYRIDMHERLWPYYFGYTILISTLYFQTDNPFLLSLYNIYMLVILSVPFLAEIKYPRSRTTYPKINLKLFSTITNLAITIVNHLMKFIQYLNSLLRQDKLIHENISPDKTLDQNLDQSISINK